MSKLRRMARRWWHRWVVVDDDSSRRFDEAELRREGRIR